MTRLDGSGQGGYVQTTGQAADRRLFAARAQALPVNTADRDGSGQRLTEAMSVGCPIITTDSLGSGPRFVTEDGLAAVFSSHETIRPNLPKPWRPCFGPKYGHAIRN